MIFLRFIYRRTLRKRFTDLTSDLSERIGAIRIEQAERPLYQDPAKEAKDGHV